MYVRVLDVTLYQVGSLIGHDILCATSAVGVNTRTRCVVALTESLPCKQPAFNVLPCFMGTSVSALCCSVENGFYQPHCSAYYLGCSISFSGPWLEKNKIKFISMQ